MSTRFTVPEDHPSLPGHFPGQPIVPGVLLLDAVLRAAAASHPAHSRRPLRAKFPAPVAPGAEVEIQFSPRDGGRLAFSCHCGGVVVLLGEL
ncbi:MAG: beta-hydroxyacyl-ACP dehydratase [Rubritepida sp.]|nr:beta-hydroxyacyl-ACP dehydratase [Rubritepida sp.]